MTKRFLKKYVTTGDMITEKRVCTRCKCLIEGGDHGVWEYVDETRAIHRSCDNYKLFGGFFRKLDEIREAGQKRGDFKKSNFQLINELVKGVKDGEI